MTHEEMQEKIKSDFYKNNGAVQFYEDLIELCNLNGSDPAVLHMYSLAWKNGYIYGYQEVFNHFNDLIRVFRT